MVIRGSLRVKKDGHQIDVEFSGSSSDDIMVDAAFWLEGPVENQDLTQEDLDWISKNYYGEMESVWLENAVGAAEAWRESMEER